jgi:hypothetical protein
MADILCTMCSKSGPNGCGGCDGSARYCSTDCQRLYVPSISSFPNTCANPSLQRLAHPKAPLQDSKPTPKSYAYLKHYRYPPPLGYTIFHLRPPPHPIARPRPLLRRRRIPAPLRLAPRPPGYRRRLRRRTLRAPRHHRFPRRKGLQG